MTETRDQLISNWRQQLAQAQTADTNSPRDAWLRRTQVRLFRFMLANYGHQRWRPLEGDSLLEEKANAQPAVETIVAAAADLDGKPARSDGEIRCVLDSVATAHSPAAYAPGPLAGGLDPDSWVIVAAASSKLKVGRCAELLRAAGLNARTSWRGDDHMVEVPARERQQAFAIIDQNRSRVHAPPRTPRTRRIPLWCQFAAAAVVRMWVTGSLAWMMMLMIWTVGPPAQIRSPLELTAIPEFYPVWGSLFVAMVMLLGLDILRRNRPLAASRRRARQ